MADEPRPDDQEYRRRLFSDVWGEAPDDSSFPGPKDDVDLPPLIERGMNGVRLDQLERSLREARAELDDLRASVRGLSSTIERIARRLQMSGYTENT